MSLLRPQFLLLFIVYIPLIYWYIRKCNGANPYMGISTTEAFASVGISWKVVLMHLSFVIRLLAIGALIVALCRPQTHDSVSTSQVEGTDIIIAMDISGSMTTSDFEPNRFEAAKDVATKFVNSRESDNIGLVVFAGESLSLMPLTNDRAALVNAIRNINMDNFTDGTAIGDGLASAINRISSGQAKSKSIILLTDGTNNSGTVPPMTAAQIARQRGIRVYTIGIGTNGSIRILDPYGIPTTIDTRIDENSLQTIAASTDGKYFRARDKHMLAQVFEEIDKLEKTKLDVNHYSRTDEYFMPFVWLALILFGVELLLRYTVLRRVP